MRFFRFAFRFYFDIYGFQLWLNKLLTTKILYLGEIYFYTTHKSNFCEKKNTSFYQWIKQETVYTRWFPLPLIHGTIRNFLARNFRINTSSPSNFPTLSSKCIGCSNSSPTLCTTTTERFFPLKFSFVIVFFRKSIPDLFYVVWNPTCYPLIFHLVLFFDLR